MESIHLQAFVDGDGDGGCLFHVVMHACKEVVLLWWVHKLPVRIARSATSSFLHEDTCAFAMENTRRVA
jgi:hypothetical protein